MFLGCSRGRYSRICWGYAGVRKQEVRCAEEIEVDTESVYIKRKRCAIVYLLQVGAQSASASIRLSRYLPNSILSIYQ